MRLLLALLVVLTPPLWPSCAIDEEPSRAREPGLAVTRVRYLFERTKSPKAFRTQRGDAIKLERAVLAYSSIGLSKCTPSAPSTKASWLRGLLDIPVAYAGHEGVLDHSYAAKGWVVDLIDGPDTALADERFFPSTRYCRAQTVNGRADESFVGYPKAFSLSGYSMHMRGRITRAGGSAQPFVLETDLAYGTLRDLPTDAQNEALTIAYVHDLRGAFEGVELEGDLERVSKTVLKNLVDHTRMDVRTLR